MLETLSRRIVLAAALAATVVLAALAGAEPASAKAKTCADAVVADWYGDGRVDEIFPIHCYQEAIRSLPVDVLDYSNAKEDILRALAYARQDKADPGPSGGGQRPTGATSTTDTNDTPAPAGDDDGPGADAGTPGGGGPDDGGATVAANDVDTSGPSSLPIPLLILGGLALLLLAAGGAGYLSRRAQARREGGPPGPA
ncbi:MAG: hypothetical protein M5U27_14510 [Gaiella sp.]|nr:hypothetical protein [Gaiella sp.]